MNLKRFKYENGLDIIAPLKHGTRWLEEKTNPLSIENYWCPFDKIKDISKQTYWVYREPKNFIVSALRTEIRVAIEFDKDNTDSIVDGFINRNGTHWSPELYRWMYLHWNIKEFNLIHLKDLSNLFIGIEYDSKNYDMSNYLKSTYTTEDIIKLVDSNKLNQLYELSDKDTIWLTKMLNKEHNLI